MPSARQNNQEPIALKELAEISDHYDTFLVDMIGVIHDGIRPYTEAIQALNQLFKLKKQIVLISNNPRPGQLSHQKMVQFGLNEQIPIFTSGDAVRHLLQTQWHQKTFYHLGAIRNQDLLRDIPHQEVDDIARADFILLSAFLEPHETRGIIQEDLNAIIRYQKPVVCANPDLTAIHGDQRRTCAGSIGAYLQEQGVAVTYIGKPHPNIFQGAAEAYHLIFEPSKTLMIGDTLETDILGGNDMGYDTLLVLTGITYLDMKTEQQQAVHAALIQKDPALRPTYFMSALRF